MYSRFQLTKKYLNYYLHASSGKGFGVHSPFVYDFIIHVLNGKAKSPAAGRIEAYRRKLLSDHHEIEVDDFGAGSAVNKQRNRKVSTIARSALKNRKYAALLYRIAAYYGCEKIVELGTSLGTTTAYLASATAQSSVFTLEGAGNIAAIAEDFFSKNDFQNIQLIRGNFEDKIPEIINRIDKVDLLFVDGNHREEPTRTYFETFLTKKHNGSIFIFDDIHWSAEMEQVWNSIKQHNSVTLTIDLFFVGLVFFKDEFMSKQDFVIRF